jgi:hypothetical protein
MTEWLLIGIASFVIWCGLAMAGSGPGHDGGSNPAMTGVERRDFRRLVLLHSLLRATPRRQPDGR